MCEDLVKDLYAQKGDEFHKAARLFEATTRPVVFVAGDDARLGYAVSVFHVNRDGLPNTFTLGHTPDDKSGVFINQEQSKGDLLLTAVHESGHLLGKRDGDPFFDRQGRTAYNQLDAGLRGDAVLHARLYFGTPLPADYVEGVPYARRN